MRQDMRSVQAQVVRDLAFALDKAFLSYSGPEAHRLEAQKLKLDALEYVKPTDAKVVWPLHAMRLLAWSRAWLLLGQDGAVDPHAEFRAEFARLQADRRWLAAVGKAQSLPLPRGPSEEWEDACERELVA